jgi:hypothetical protein
MRKLALLPLAALIVAGPAFAQDKPPVVARAEQCLAAKVDQVVAADPDINSAASFLVTYACAEEVTRASHYERNVATVKAYTGMFGAMSQLATASAAAKDAKNAKGKDAKSEAAAANMAKMFDTSGMGVDPETGDIVLPKDGGGLFAGMMPQINQAQAATGGNEPVPVSLRKLAGELVMAAQMKRMAKH